MTTRDQLLSAYWESLVNEAIVDKHVCHSKQCDAKTKSKEHRSKNTGSKESKETESEGRNGIGNCIDVIGLFIHLAHNCWAQGLLQRVQFWVHDETCAMPILLASHATTHDAPIEHTSPYIPDTLPHISHIQFTFSPFQQRLMCMWLQIQSMEMEIPSVES